jgi:peptide-methionine (S)-S-oxide reductase
MSVNTETAILAGGCFWPAQELLRHRDGVIATRVGYIGGENDNPTAEDHPGHAEAVEVIFDPERTSYRDVLEFFFQIHRADLAEELIGSDYRSEIFYATDKQRHVAEDTIVDADAADLWPGKVVTKISQAGRFWEAEAEDQDYLQHYGRNTNAPCGDQHPVARATGWGSMTQVISADRPAVPARPELVVRPPVRRRGRQDG